MIQYIYFKGKYYLDWSSTEATPSTEPRIRNSEKLASKGKKVILNLPFIKIYNTIVSAFLHHLINNFLVSVYLLKN